MPRYDFTAGQILTAAQMDALSDQTVMTFGGTAARGSAIPSPIEGMITYLEDLNIWEGYTTDWVPIGGKILQVVRATDTTQRSTTSTSFVDASLSVTITPRFSTSNIFLLSLHWVQRSTSGEGVNIQITDSSNVAISGAERQQLVGLAQDLGAPMIVIGWASPGTTSATTYKNRFRSSNGNSVFLQNNTNTAQLFAIEVTA